MLIYRVRNETASGGGPIEVIDTHPHTEACWDQSVYPPLADAPLRVGETYTVPGEHTTGRGRGPDAVGRVDGQDHHRHVSIRRAGPARDERRSPPLCARGFFRLCAARDSNPGPAD